MIRTILTVVVPLIAPTLAYLIWMQLRSQRKEDEEAGRAVPKWQKLPWPWLIVSGAALAAVALVSFGYFERSADITRKYIPPTLEDGKVVPGRFEEQQ